MAGPEKRTFRYKPVDSSAASLQSRVLVESIRSWLFSTVGLICAWLLAIGIVIPALAGIILLLHERVSLTLIMLGAWWIAGLSVIHWWIPAARRATARTEGLAAAGWHVALTMAATGLVAWVIIFRDGPYSPFTLRDTPPVVVSWVFFNLLFGGLLIWFRGHTRERTVRYFVVAFSMAAVWMSLWLVAAHAWF